MRTERNNSEIQAPAGILKFINLYAESNALLSKMEGILERYGLNLNKLNALQILAATKDLAVMDLKDRLDNKTCDLSRLLVSLGHEGYILVKTDRRDKRARIVNITSRGLNILAKIYEREDLSFNEGLNRLAGIMQTLNYTGLQQLQNTQGSDTQRVAV